MNDRLLKRQCGNRPAGKLADPANVSTKTVTAKFRAETLANCGPFSAEFSPAREGIIAEIEQETNGKGRLSCRRLVTAI